MFIDDQPHMNILVMKELKFNIIKSSSIMIAIGIVLNYY